MKKNLIKGHLLPFIMLPLVFNKETTPEKFAEDVDKEIDALRKGQIDKETFKSELESGMKSVVETEVTAKTTALKTELDALKLTADADSATLVKQGEEIASLKAGAALSPTNRKTVRQLFGEAIKKALETKDGKNIFDGLDASKGDTFPSQFNKSFIVKDALPADPSLHSTENIPVGVITGGVTASVNADWLLLNAAQRASKVFGAPILKNNILNYLPVKRLVGKILYGTVFAAPTGAAAYTPECVLKPQVKQTLRVDKVEAGKIAEVIRMSEEYFMYVWEVVDNEIMPRYEQLLTNALAAAIFDGAANGASSIDGIVDNASTYTLVPQHQMFTAPNLLDVIAAAVNSLEINEWNVSIIALNPANQLQLNNSKASDGHYDTFNNGSIQLVDGQQIFVNGGIVPIIYSNSVAADKIFVASFDAFEVGISDQLAMKISNSARDGDFEHNLWTIVLEKFCAVLSPTESTGGILYDSINNIKTLITVEAP